MARWALRCLTHAVGLAVFAVCFELLLVGGGKVLSAATGLEPWSFSRDVQEQFGAPVAALVHAVPAALVLVPTLPVFRLIASLGWPGRVGLLAWGQAGLGLGAVAWLAFTLVLSGYITAAEMSLLLMLFLLTAGFTWHVMAQRRAGRLAEEKAAKDRADVFA